MQGKTDANDVFTLKCRDRMMVATTQFLQ